MVPRIFWFRNISCSFGKKKWPLSISDEKEKYYLFIFPEIIKIGGIGDPLRKKNQKMSSIYSFWGSILINRTQMVFLYLNGIRYKITETNTRVEQLIEILSKKYNFSLKLGKISKIYKIS